MNRKKTIHRLVATGIMTAFTAASLITTSFAFVTLNTNASISEFTFEIEDQEGLLLSVDGDKFFQDIDADTIKGTILANNAASTYEDIKLTGVTLGGRNSDSDPYAAGLYKEQYSYKIGQKEVEITDERVTFIKDNVTWLDKNNPTDASAITAARENATLDALFAKNDRVGVHTYQAATNGDYIFFDLWLRVAQNGIGDDETHPTYQLKFTDRTTIEGRKQTVELYNDLYVPSSLVPTTPYSIAGNDVHLDGSGIDDGHYLAGDKITVNPADAMRLGINVLGNSQTNKSSAGTNTYDNIKNSLRVYEPNAGLGSYAVNSTYTDERNSRENALFNPAQNAMFTYYNSLNPLRPFLAGVDSTPGQIDTYLNFCDADETDDTDVLAEFTWNSTSKDYNVVKMSVMLWLEGWDADYFVGLKNTAITVRLGFEVKEKTQNNG